MIEVEIEISKSIPLEFGHAREGTPEACLHMLTSLLFSLMFCANADTAFGKSEFHYIILIVYSQYRND